MVAEALARGHDVSAVVRTDAQSATLPEDVTARVADLQSAEQVADIMAGHDLAISALRPPDGEEHRLVPLTQMMLEAASRLSVRVLVVGGAASLEMPDGSGHTVLSAPGFLPEAVVPIARACQAQYKLITGASYADWTYLCPPAMLIPGEHTGRYRIGGDVLLVDQTGKSEISMEDFAVALIDEIESPQHKAARFTVAY